MNLAIVSDGYLGSTLGLVSDGFAALPEISSPAPSKPRITLAPTICFAGGMADMITTVFRTGTYRVTRTGVGTTSGGIYTPRPAIELDISTIDPDLDTLTAIGHGIAASGAGPVWATSDDTLPGGIPADTAVWLIVVDEDTLQLAADFDTAVAGEPIADILDAGAGTLHLSTSFTIDASVQPVEGRSLRDLPEGMRAEESRLVFTRCEVRTVQRFNEPDLIEIDGELYRFRQAQKYGTLSGGHYRCWAERIEVP